MFGMDVEDCPPEDQNNSENDEKHGGDGEPKSFVLLNDLSDLLMLPKDMLIDRKIRQEVSFWITYPFLLLHISFTFYWFVIVFIPYVLLLCL